MEVRLNTKTVSILQQLSDQEQQTQLDLESVVPDTRDDIGRIVTVQSNVYLKSKDITSRGLTVGGELEISVLYITEDGKSLSVLRTGQSFSLDFEYPERDGELITLARLQLKAIEARLINPRKLSLSAEILGKLQIFSEHQLPIQYFCPEESAQAVHLLSEHRQSCTINAVCEKSFTINEQFPFPDSSVSTAGLLFQKVQFQIGETQLIGSRLLIKGTMELTACCLSESGNLPITASFSAPFSQLLELGKEQMDNCEASIQLSAAYYNIVDTVGTGKVLDCEIHAVVQAQSRCTESIELVTDAYSNQYPMEIDSCELSLLELPDVQTLPITVEERVELPEDCSQCLAVFPSTGLPGIPDGKLCCHVTLDLLCRTAEGTFSTVKRVLSSETVPAERMDAVPAISLQSISYRPDGSGIFVRVNLSAAWSINRVHTQRAVAALIMDDAAPLDLTSFPDLTVVRPNGESLWQLAQNYHSSPEAIQKLNDALELSADTMLFIPRVV